MKHHTSIIIFLFAFFILSMIVFKPNTQVMASKVDSELITTQQLDSLSNVIGLDIPTTVKTTITTKQDFMSYLLVTVGSFLTVIIMSLLRFFFPKIFPTPN